MGTPDIAVPILKMLIDKTNVLLVVSKPDKEVGRKRVIEYTPVKKAALENNIQVFQPDKVKNDFEIIKKLKPDIIITCAFGEIISEEILNIPRLGALNVHASLLPKYRGSSPIQASLLNGDDVTGVTLMYMDKGMDTGDIIKQREIVIDEEDNVLSLSNKMAIVGKELLEEELPLIMEGKNSRVKQNNEEATYTKMINREDEKLDFNESYMKVFNKIRAFSPFPLAYFVLDGVEIKVIKASCRENEDSKAGYVREITKHTFGIDAKCGTIYLEVVKPMGKKEMDITSFINGIDKDKLIGMKVM